MKKPKEVFIFYILLINNKRGVINRNPQCELLRLSVKKHISTIVNNHSITIDLHCFNTKSHC
ncbi:hypothetical protein SAMN02927925_02285 [Flavobacterium saliperosum]|uniref:Uncharacterized protein n=1 Tax=Flavobacterium saliperosum TaxID=329186 RepID=A0A1G4W2V5_9FLAO|nr:hypothetical protein SAMN02927925_02285 [Flavobacterium saliperosum]